MPITYPSCSCPNDSRMQSLAKINNNLVNLFTLMSSGAFVGKLVNVFGCLCSEAEILKALNNNVVNFFNWLSINGAQANTVDLALNDESKAVVFDSAFSSAPVVVGIIVAPDNTGSVISAGPDQSTLTATGVTFLFGGAIPGSGYKLMWFARAPSS